MDKITDQIQPLNPEQSELVEAERVLRDLEAENADAIAVFAARMDMEAKRKIVNGDGEVEVEVEIVPAPEIVASFITNTTVQKPRSVGALRPNSTPRNTAKKASAPRASRQPRMPKTSTGTVVGAISSKIQSAMQAADAAARHIDVDLVSSDFTIPSAGSVVIN